MGGYDNTERSENSKKSVLCGKKVTDIAKMEKLVKNLKILSKTFEFYKKFTIILL